MKIDFAIGMGVLKNPLLISLARCVERFFYRRATQVIANSPAYLSAIAERGVADDKLSFLANAVDLDLFHPASRGEKLREQFGLGDKFVVTYAGALGRANRESTTMARTGKRTSDVIGYSRGRLGPGKQQLARDLEYSPPLHPRPASGWSQGPG